MGKESACNAGDTRDADSVPGLGRSPGGRHGNPLQCSCLGNLIDRGTWQATVGGSQRAGRDWACTQSPQYPFKIYSTVTPILQMRGLRPHGSRATRACSHTVRKQLTQHPPVLTQLVWWPLPVKACRDSWSWLLDRGQCSNFLVSGAPEPEALTPPARVLAPPPSCSGTLNRTAQAMPLLCT